MLQPVTVTTPRKRGRPPAPPESKAEGKTKNTTIRLSPEALRIGRALAVGSGVSLTVLVEDLIKRAYEGHPAKAVIDMGLASGAFDPKPRK